jgi:hypothetical protein
MRDVRGLRRSVIIGIKLDAVEPERFGAAVNHLQPHGLQAVACEPDAEYSLALAIARHGDRHLDLSLATGLRPLHERTLVGMRRVVDGQPSPR